jgi:hypothetical protein
MKLALEFAAIMALSITAAAANNSNSAAALNMVDDLRAGAGSAAPTVSGEEFRSNSGWGNNGSELVSGQRVSRGR